jgi:hypothetical protein
MPANDQKVLSIIVEEIKSVEDRCTGYHEALLDAVGDIIRAEREHRARGTNIQQQVNDKCSSVGEYLNKTRGVPKD